MSLDLSQILTQIIAFLVMLWILKRYGWKPLLGLLQERQDKIKTEFDLIASQQAHAQQLLKIYEGKLKEIEVESRHMIRDAATQARKVAAEIEKEAQNKARQIISQGQEEAKREIAGAYMHLRKDMVQTVIQVTEKLLGQKLEGEDHKKLIEDFVEEPKAK